ncbi:MAG: DUF881 domain-containing protein [Candidatus Phosphoribacter baldrii]|jgi:uncharacterized protein YlxW (UPF0749 family)|nr:DUF881 domain-containing protein [Dermatophilaceae bacterium]
MPSTPGRPQSRLWRALAPAVFGLAGLLFATSFQAARGTDLRSDRGLPGLIDTANRDVAAKSSTIEKLQNELDALTAAAAPSDGRIVPLTGTINLLAPHVGTRAVQGPALTVALTDSNRSMANLPPSIRPDDLVVHQQDVQAVVNALWRGGAEAMMIQDQRVIATSAVRCVGNTLILQGRVYSPPYVISAIGKIDALTEALDKDPQVTIYKEWVDAVGLGYRVTTEAKATFPAYSGPVSQSVAKVAK